MEKEFTIKFNEPKNDSPFFEILLESINKIIFHTIDGTFMKKGDILFKLVDDNWQEIKQ